MKGSLPYQDDTKGGLRPKEGGRAPSGQALVASDGAPAGLHPSGFDPSRRHFAFVNMDLASSPDQIGVAIIRQAEAGRGDLIDFRLCADADEAESFMAAYQIDPQPIWTRDSDRSASATKPAAERGSAVGESAGPQGIAPEQSAWIEDRPHG